MSDRDGGGDSDSGAEWTVHMLTLGLLPARHGQWTVVDIPSSPWRLIYKSFGFHQCAEAYGIPHC